MVKKNIGPLDRMIRLGVAVVIFALYLMGVLSGTVAILLISVAVILVLTSLMSTCLLYLPFGLTTLKK